MLSRYIPRRQFLTWRRPSRTDRSGSPLRHTRLRHEPLEHRLVLDAGGPAEPWIAADALVGEQAIEAQGAFGPAAAELQENSNALAKFTSAEHLEEYLIDDALERYADLFGQPGYSGWYRVALADPEGGVLFAAAAVDAVTADGYSDTNTQVAGVDEGDIVETDGNYLYVLGDTDVAIIDVRDSGQMQVASRFDVPGRPFAEYLIGDRLTVLSREWAELRWDPPMMTFSSEGLHSPEGPILTVTVIDVSDRQAPSLVDQTELDGSYVDSRAIGDSVYVLSSNDFVLPGPMLIPVLEEEAAVGTQELLGDLQFLPYPDGGYVYETQEQYLDRVQGHVLDLSLPRFVVSGPDGEAAASSLLTEPTDVYQPGSSNDTNLLNVVVFDVGDTDPGPASSVGVPVHSSAQAYVSPDSLYVFNYAFGWWNQTEETSILKFDLDREDGSVELSATGTVPGSILNQFSVDEYDGYLRVATTSGRAGRWTGQGDSANNVFVLQQDGQTLETIGQLENLAAGERIYSVRFMGDRAFVVTFRMVDPLFAIDISDPTDPQVKGELKIPGFSNYLHAIDEDHLIGIGRHADEQTGLFADPQVSLFGVGDLANPELLDRYTLEAGRIGGVNAVPDHHAVAYYPDYRVLTVSIPAPDSPGSYHGANDLWVFKIDTLAVGNSDPQPNEIRLLGRIEHDQSVRRSVRIGDELFAVSEDSVTVHDIFDPQTQLGELDFEMLDLREVGYREVADVDLSTGDRWYHFTTTRDGILTVQARFAESSSEEVQLTLYDGFQNELTTSNDLAFLYSDAFPMIRRTDEQGLERIDWQTEAGQVYYVCASGMAENVELAVGNLLEYVREEDVKALYVYGTNESDTFEMQTYMGHSSGSGDVYIDYYFDAHAVVVNGLRYDFHSSFIMPGDNAIFFDGGAGRDSIDLDLKTWAGSYNVEAHLRPNSGTITQTDDSIGKRIHRLELKNFSSITVVGGDFATLDDSDGVDTYVATPDYAELSGPGYLNRVENFDNVHAYSRAGDDVAQLYDSPNDDRFVATDTYGKLYGEGFFNRAKWFRYVHAYSTAGGDDTAKLSDSAGNDTFLATPTYGKLSGEDFYCRAKFFRYVHAYAKAGGSDVARFVDSPGDDTFVVTPRFGKMYGDGFFTRAKFFDVIHNRSASGGIDRVRASDAVFQSKAEMEELINRDPPLDCIVWLYNVEQIEGRHGPTAIADTADKILAAYWPR